MIKSLLLSGLSFPEIDRAIRRRTFKACAWVAFFALITGVALGQWWRIGQLERSEMDLSSYKSKTEVHRNHLVTRLADSEGDCGKRIAAMKGRR